VHWVKKPVDISGVYFKFSRHSWSLTIYDVLYLVVESLAFVFIFLLVFLVLRGFAKVINGKLG